MRDRTRTRWRRAATIAAIAFYFGAALVVAPARPSAERTAAGIEFSVGNLSVPLLLKKWGSPLIGMDVDPSPAAHRAELATIIDEAGEVGAGRIEDYVGWAVVEPKKGRWKWQVYRDNARAIHGSGLGYVPFVWIQNLPRWVRDDPSYTRARCVEHGLECEALSVFSPKTIAFYDRFFAQMARRFGEQIDLLRVGAPNDFGEASYPVGVATFAFPDRHIHPGFWVDEPEAHAEFREAMRARYTTLDAVNAAWETSFESFDGLDYPSDASRRRWWLDFVAWYHDAHTEKMGEILDAARAHFPSTPINLNLGFPDERIVYGQDLTGVVKMASARGAQIRTPTGPLVPFLYTKRVATAASFYGLTGFSSEPVDGEAPAAAVAGAVFKDLTTGVTLHFDYPPNMARGRDSIEAERRLWRGEYPLVDTALFFSTAGHRLADGQRDQGFEGYPENLVPFSEGLREVLDYDVVDERLVDDGALARYRVIVWPVGFVTEVATLAKLRSWVEGGGVLVIGDLARLATVEGDRGAFADIPETGTTRVGAGAIVDGGGDLSRVASVVVNRAFVATGAVSTSDLLPPIDRADDGVLVSLFADGVMLFNSTDAPVTKSLAIPPGPWRVSYEGLPQSVDLAPFEIVWVRAARPGA